MTEAGVGLFHEVDAREWGVENHEEGRFRVMRGAAPEAEALRISRLRAAYSSDARAPSDTVRAVCERIAARGEDGVWIHVEPRDKLSARARELEARGPDARELPLYGVPFAVKDNIDVAGVPTTAACPEYAWTPEKNAPCVELLLDAGAIFIGKTNLDQFALGLTGARTPYGVAGNPFHEDYIPGGSSSGSAVAVAAGLASFALGTDTAGSGRVPAGFNNIVGLKPSRGLVSARGVVPACRTLDCVSVFALEISDALRVLKVMAVPDAGDAYGRALPAGASLEAAADLPEGLKAGAPLPAQREFLGDDEARRVYESGLARIEEMGVSVEEIDFSPLYEAAELIYGGPWMAERLAAIEEFFQEKPESLHPVTRELMADAARYSAVDAFRAFHRLEELKREAEEIRRSVDFLATPTTPTAYTIAEVDAAPVALNANLGTYANFVNLLDLSAVAIPNGFYANGLPIGVTLIASAFREGFLCGVAENFLARMREGVE